MTLDINTVIILLIAGLNAYTAYQTNRNGKTAATTQGIVRRTEVNTDGMRVALVAATEIAAHAAGKEEGRAEGEAKAAVLAQGKLDGQS